MAIWFFFFAGSSLPTGHRRLTRLSPRSLPMQCLGNAASKDEGLLLGEAARAIGVSADTLRRWDRAGKVRTVRDGANRRRVPRAEVERLRRPPAAPPPPATRCRRATASPASCASVEVDGVMALVEIEAGPHRVTAAVTRDAVEELGLAPGRAGHGRRQGHLGDGGARRRD